MTHLINRMVLFSVCTLLLVTGNFDRLQIIPILFCLIVELYELYRPDRKLFMINYVGFCMLMIPFPQLAFFLPLRIYSLISWDFRIGLLGFLELLVIYPHVNILQILILSLISSLLGFYATKQLDMRQRFLQFRDTQSEQEAVLKRHNKELLEKQDYEIYAATLHERNRIAREIHDHVGHQLSSSILQVAALSTIEQDEQMKAHLNTLKHTLDQAMNDIRSSVHDLYDESFDLRSSIERLLSQFSFCEWDLDYDVHSSLDRKLKFSFIAIIKEALSNVSRHSDATMVHIRVIEHPALIQLQIDDNGSGIQPIQEEGIGLLNMRDRVAKLNGRIQISQHEGFHIFVSVDKEEKENENYHH